MPMDQCITIASACMATFKKQFLKMGTIGIIPPGGYNRKENQSNKVPKKINNAPNFLIGTNFCLGPAVAYVCVGEVGHPHPARPKRRRKKDWGL